MEAAFPSRGLSPPLPFVASNPLGTLALRFGDFDATEWELRLYETGTLTLLGRDFGSTLRGL
jgi:hypothetical protein